MPARIRMAAQNAGEGRQKHQREHHGQILDDQPADGDAPIDRAHEIALFQRLEKHDGTGNGKAEAKDHPGADAPAP